MTKKQNENFLKIEERIEILEKRNKSLLRGLYFVVGLFFVVVCGLLGFINISPVEAQNPTSQTLDSLRVRQITVVDEKGTERIYIGSPVPDAMTAEGKRVKRVKPSTGIVFNNIRGEEMSGWGVFDDESQNLCFDYKGAERLCLLQSGERAGLVIKGSDGNLLTMLGRIGYSEDAPKLWLNDFSGKNRLKLQVDGKTGEPKLEFFDDKGKQVQTLSQKKK